MSRRFRFLACRSDRVGLTDALRHAGKSAEAAVAECERQIGIVPSRIEREVIADG